MNGLAATVPLAVALPVVGDIRRKKTSGVWSDRDQPAANGLNRNIAILSINPALVSSIARFPDVRVHAVVFMTMREDAERKRSGTGRSQEPKREMDARFRLDHPQLTGVIVECFGFPQIDPRDVATAVRLNHRQPDQMPKRRARSILPAWDVVGARGHTRESSGIASEKTAEVAVEFNPTGGRSHPACSLSVRFQMRGKLVRR